MTPRRVYNQVLALFSDSFDTSGRTVSGLWSRLGSSFRTRFGFRARRAREILCGTVLITTRKGIWETDFYPVLVPEGPRIEKNQSREAILKKSSFQHGMKFSIGNGFFIPGPSLAAERQGLGLKFSMENESFKPRIKFQARMKISCVGECFFHAIERE